MTQKVNETYPCTLYTKVCFYGKIFSIGMSVSGENSGGTNMERQSVTMKQRPETERPYEKCLKAGAESLTDGELLAVLIRCGTKNYSALELAFALLDRHPVYKGLAGLYHLDMEMLKTIPGIGNVKAIEILCALELSKRLARASIKEESDFSSPEYIGWTAQADERDFTVERNSEQFLDSGSDHFCGGASV